MPKDIAHYILYNLSQNAHLPMETLITSSLINEVVERWNHRIYITPTKEGQILRARKDNKIFKM